MASKCVALDTEAGMIDIEMFPESAPESVRNFLNLAATGVYDTTVFSRVVPGFVIQGGDLYTRTYSPLKQFELWLLDLVGAEPDLTLEGIRTRLAAEKRMKSGTTSIWRFYERHKITIKKTLHALMPETRLRVRP